MPRYKIAKTQLNKTVQNQNYVPNNDQDDDCNTNLQTSENNLQYGHVTSGSQFKTIDSEASSNFEPTQNNHASFQPSTNCQTDLKPAYSCCTDLQQCENGASDISLTQNLQTQNCINDRVELAHNSEDFQNDSTLKPKNLLIIKNEPCDTNSTSKEVQDTSEPSQQDQNHHPDPDSQLEDLSIRTKLDPDSNAVQNFHELSQSGNKMHIKSELCNLNPDSHSSKSESMEEVESCSESFECSNETCDLENDRSNCSQKETVKDEKPDEDNCADSPPSQDLKRSRRNSKRKRDLEGHCPVCSLTIRCSELENHFSKEVENLSNIAKNIRRNRTGYKDREGFRCGISLAFIQAKCNRENRIEARRTKYAKRNIVCCPVCKIQLVGTDEEINDHVFSCFGEDDDSDVNITDHDDNFEEYEIGNETRVRAISLVPGGHRSLHGYSSKSKSTNDEDDGDLNVDVDDTLAFGKPQYTELDVIHNTTNASDEREMEQLRRAVISDPSAEPHVIEGNKWSQNYEIQNEIDEINNSCVKSKPEEVVSKEDEEKDTKDEEKIQKTKSGIISTLKERIRDLEQQKPVKCLICLEPYTRPVVSTTCWHVHCEECWLVSMGVKKLCPQCNMIVFPTDLRRIYL